MTMTDPVGDMLTRIRNGQRAKKASVTSPASKLRKAILDVLKSEGFIRGYKEVNLRPGINELEIELKYYEGEAVIKTLKRVSKPGRRIYSAPKDINRVANGLGISIISTSHGVITDAQARSQNIGGEVLCEVY